MKKKERLDKLLVERGLVESREKAKAMVLAGVVIVGHHRVDKPGTLISIEEEIRLKGTTIPFVSRGGLKLQAALDEFQLDAKGKIILDLGASTGGFTDCLLQAGAQQIYCVDVGYGQLHSSLRNHPQVVNFERINARKLMHPDLNLEEDFRFDWIVTDVSFISVKLLLPTVASFLALHGLFVCLVKPQFEAGKEQVGKGGVVREDTIRIACADAVAQEALSWGLREIQRKDCPIHGPKGNQEILVLFRKEKDIDKS